MNILFVDAVCPKPYSPETLATEPLGGTEATIIRIAEALGGVTVMQAGRTETYRANSTYVPLDLEQPGRRWDAIVLLRDPLLLPNLRKASPDARIYLWLHDLTGGYLMGLAALLEAYKPTLLTVSNFHRMQTVDRLQAVGLKDFRVKTIYNPVMDSLQPDSTPVDKNKLVFFSSPHKGLNYVYKTFQYALRFNPAFKLFVANPGYAPDLDLSGDPNVVNLGRLPHNEILSHVRSALCVYYPNTVFPETFGLVFAEANAVGTPVIAHNFGAAREVLNHPSQTLDCKDIKTLIDRLMAWHSGNRPVVRCRPEFRISEVIQSWRELFKPDHKGVL